jgi:hypothetical protein
MPDIKEIAATYAARIFDRMELCRGSAILKSDIEREVEMALCEYAGETPILRAMKEVFEQEENQDSMFCVTLADAKYDEHLGPVLKRVYPHITPEGTIYIDDEAAKTTIIGKPYSVLQAERHFHEAYERAKQYLAVNSVDPPSLTIAEKTDPSCDFLVGRVPAPGEKTDKFGNAIVTVKIDVQADSQSELLSRLHHAMAEREINPDECLGAFGWPSATESMMFMGINWKYDNTLMPCMAVIWHRNAVVTPCTVLHSDAIIYGTCARANS